MRKWRVSASPHWAALSPLPPLISTTSRSADLPQLADTFPEDSPHLAKAKLARQRRPQRLHPSRNCRRSRFGFVERTRRSTNLRILRRDLSCHARTQACSARRRQRIHPVHSAAYWHILFPEPYWTTIKTESAKNGLDPYLVASLIRQESEFNPSVISYANAWGLMQLLPSGRQIPGAPGGYVAF